MDSVKTSSTINVISGAIARTATVGASAFFGSVLLGATIGSAFPIIGTVAGAIVGGILGTGIGAMVGVAMVKAGSFVLNKISSTIANKEKWALRTDDLKEVIHLMDCIHDQKQLISQSSILSKIAFTDKNNEKKKLNDLLGSLRNGNFTIETDAFNKPTVRMQSDNDTKTLNSLRLFGPQHKRASKANAALLKRVEPQLKP